jgi:hypothetical protein
MRLDFDSLSQCCSFSGRQWELWQGLEWGKDDMGVWYGSRVGVAERTGDPLSHRTQT